MLTSFTSAGLISWPTDNAAAAVATVVISTFFWVRGRPAAREVRL